LNRAITSPQLKDKLVKDGFDPIPSTPAQAQARLSQELASWNKLIKARGITAD
jgi:tripartite-type tricarboxylate transporter receptor subunit TctC